MIKLTQKYILDTSKSTPIFIGVKLGKPVKKEFLTEDWMVGLSEPTYKIEGGSELKSVFWSYKVSIVSWSVAEDQPMSNV